MKRKLRVLWRWLIQPLPPPGTKYADNVDLPGLAPITEPLPDEKIKAMQDEMIAHQGREFMRLNDSLNKIARHIHANYGEDQRSGLHARIGGEFSDLVIYYLKRERYLQDKMNKQIVRSFITEDEGPTV
jgi:hypothetical protein